MRFFDRPTLRSFLILIFVLIVSLPLGIALGGMLGSILEVKDNPSLPKSAVGVAEETSLSHGSWTGTVRKIDPSDAGGGSLFRLFGNGDKVVAELQSPKIDLRFLEGMRVTIEGRRIRVLAGDLPLIQVEKVNLKLR